jgi:hypothetical protein
MRMEKTRTTRKITEWTPYKARPVGRPRLRWMDQVEGDLKRMRITGWRERAEDREEWSKIVERPRPTQGCRVDRRRRTFVRLSFDINIQKYVPSKRTYCLINNWPNSE